MPSRAVLIALQLGALCLVIAFAWLFIGEPLLLGVLPRTDSGRVRAVEAAVIGILVCSVLVAASVYMVLRRQPRLGAAANRGKALSYIQPPRLQSLAESVPDVWWVVDVETSRFVYVSPSVEEQRGYLAVEVLRQDLAAAFTRDSLQHLMRVLPERVEAYREGRTATYTDEIEQTCRNGGSLWTETRTRLFQNEANGRLEMCGISRDRTAQRQDEAIKRESKARLDLIHHCARLGYIDIDSRSLQVFWSDETFRLLGYEPQSFIPTHQQFLERIHPEDLQTVREDLSALLMENTIPDSEYRIVRPDGETLWVYGRGELVRDEQGKPLRYIMVLFDITVRKRNDQQLRASVREKEVLLKEIHHRVKNNLQIISSLISLQASHVKDEESKVLFEESRSRIRALALVHERLYWSESLASIDFTEYLKGVIQDLTHGRENGEISIDLDAEHISLDVDRAIPCGLIVNELCTNALKHAFVERTGGAVVVSLHHGPNNQVILGVRDNGVGLPADLDVFRETSMGMTLVTSLVDQIGGSLSVNRIGGTAFEVSFRPQLQAEPVPSLSQV